MARERMTATKRTRVHRDVFTNQCRELLQGFFDVTLPVRRELDVGGVDPEEPRPFPEPRVHDQPVGAVGQERGGVDAVQAVEDRRRAVRGDGDAGQLLPLRPVPHHAAVQRDDGAGEPELPGVRGRQVKRLAGGDDDTDTGLGRRADRRHAARSENFRTWQERAVQVESEDAGGHAGSLPDRSDIAAG